MVFLFFMPIFAITEHCNFNLLTNLNNNEYENKDFITCFVLADDLGRLYPEWKEDISEVKVSLQPSRYGGLKETINYQLKSSHRFSSLCELFLSFFTLHFSLLCPLSALSPM